MSEVLRTAHAFWNVLHVFPFLEWWCPVYHSLIPYKVLYLRWARLIFSFLGRYSNAFATETHFWECKLFENVVLCYAHNWPGILKQNNSVGRESSFFNISHFHFSELFLSPTLWFITSFILACAIIFAFSPVNQLYRCIFSPYAVRFLGFSSGDIQISGM